MRHLLIALALAAPWSAIAVSIDRVSQPGSLPGVRAGPSLPAPARPSVPAASKASEPIVHRFEYDELGNRIKHIDAEGRVTRWEYDPMGRETARILPGGQRETREYIRGVLVAKTDFLGRTTRYGYDVMGRVASIDYPGDDDVSLTYTAVGLRETVTDAHGTTRYSYDRRDQLTGVEYPHGEAVAYEYDLAKNRTALVTAHQRVTYAYDARNRLATVTSAEGITRYGYDQVGNRTSVLRPNGVRTDYEYDAQYRLKALRHSVAATGSLLFGVAYTLGAGGERLDAEERDASGISRTIVWTYDDFERLIGERIVSRDATQSRSTTWTYDKVGNRLTQELTIGGSTFTTVYAYDENDRLLTETTGSAIIRYTYDANGNTRTRQSASGLVEYTYDDQDRLIEQRDASGRRTYQYDADGLRIGETYFPPSGASITTSYVFDKSREYPTVIEEFVQEGQGPRQLAATFTYGDELVAQTRGGATHYLLADGMGSTRLVSDAVGGVTDAYAFDAFGNELARTGATIVSHLYRGEQFDPSLGFYYLRARFYDARTGRFPTMDKFPGFQVQPASLHKYAYAHSNPISNADPTGHFVQGDSYAAVTVAAILATAAVITVDYLLMPDPEPIESKRATVWHAVASSKFKAQTASQVATGSRPGNAAVPLPQQPRGHHTIPVYLCGDEPNQQTSQITHPQHVLIHAEIAQIRIALENAEQHASRVVGHRRSQPILALARWREGRSLIATALDEMYLYGGWWQKGLPPIKDVFESERGPYVSGERTSLPWCTRSGNP